MGSGQAKPEFETVLADKYVEHGDEVILSCLANTEDVTASWKKDDKKLRCVDGKHKVTKSGTKCSLVISNTNERDEGKYTVTLSNKSVSDSCDAFVRIIIKQWRTVEWSQDGMLNDMKAFKACDKVKELRFLLYGPIGAGKSSVINSIRSILEGRPYINCLAAAGLNTTHTLCFERYTFTKEKQSFPFSFHDVMGVEQEHQGGVQPEDIISALKGHIEEGYSFSMNTPLAEGNRYYRPNPTLTDQMHCLVYIIAADKISLMENDFFTKLKQVRESTNKMKMPQVVFLTRVDLTCPLVKDDLKNIYKSKKIKEIVARCSNTLNVPENCIFPILNYHQETRVCEEINCLILDALKNIVHFANDYVLKCSDKQTSHNQQAFE